MIRHLASAAILGTAFAASALPSLAADLYRKEGTDKNIAGKEVRLRFQETERGDLISSAELRVLAGTASGPPQMMVLRAAYEIALARKSSHFIKLSETKEENGIWLYRFGFTNDPKVDPAVYFKLEQPLPKDDVHAFVSVKDLEVLFKER